MTIGLDIGSSAVRAAEISLERGTPVLRRYGKVGLPHGSVVDGEIINIPGVSAAIRRLWTEGGFTDTKVVVGVSGPRVIVRQADVPTMNMDDMRSSLRFEGQEHIPLPMDDACFDFSVLEQNATPGKDGKETTRILIVAAHRDLLRSHLAALRGAGLSPVAMDSSSLALLRVVPAIGTPDQPSGVEVLVSVGGELTTVAVRDNGVPRFIRSLTVGGSKLTETIANRMHLELAVAERLKRGAVPDGTPQLAQARKAMSVEMRDLAEDVRATVDFFVAQSATETIDRLLLTGGASLTEGLAEAIAGTLATTVRQIDPFEALSIGDLGLDEEQLSEARAGAATAVGLALWPVGPSIIRLSVLPEEVAEQRRNRQAMTMAAAGVAALTGLLAVLGGAQYLEVHSARNQVKQAQTQVSALTGQVNQLQAATAVHGQVAARDAMVVTALTGDVDWVRMLKQFASVVPPTLSLSSFEASHQLVAQSAGTTTPATPSIGTVTFSVSGTGGLPAVGKWLQGLQRDHDFTTTWVGGLSLSNNDNKIEFSSNTSLTAAAESNRANQAQQEIQP